jgi:hypothetical protein
MSQLAFQVRRAGDRVVLLYNGIGLAMHYSRAEALYFLIKRLSRAAAEYDRTGDPSKVRTDSESLDARLTVHRTGLLFTFELDGKLWIECPYQIARSLATLVYQKGKEIEEEVQYVKTAEGQAVLLQAGAPFALTGNQKIIQEAAKLIPGAGNIPSTSVVGRPTVTTYLPRR